MRESNVPLRDLWRRAKPSLVQRCSIAWAIVIVGLSQGCSRQPPPAAAPTSPAQTTSLEVVNRSSADMNMYLVRGGQRIPLGLAPGNETTRFELSPGQVAGVGTVYFQAVPRTGLARPIGSEPTVLRAGDVITLNIPPP